MHSILEDIIKKTKIRVAEAKANAPISTWTNHISRPNISFYDSLRSKQLKPHYILEVKKASPSAGIITENFNPVEIALKYKEMGASAISCLTEPDFFLGANDYLKDIVSHVDLPVLRKDFIVDEYQIHESKMLGADAILLIVALLDQKTLNKFHTLAMDMGLDVLVETHDENEIAMAIQAGANIIGINNRNLETFDVDLNTCIKLRHLIPDGKIFVAESGIKTAEHLDKMHGINATAVLIGESVVRGELLI